MHILKVFTVSLLFVFLLLGVFLMQAEAGVCPIPPCVDSVDIIDGQVKTSDIANYNVTSQKITNGAINTYKLQNNAVTGAKVLDGSLTGDDISPVTTLNVGGLNISGNVGIGTISPTEKLEVGESSNILLRAGINYPDDPGDIIFRTYTDIQKGRIWTEPASGINKLFLSSGDNDPDITIDSAGNVAIGTPTPRYRKAKFWGHHT